MKNKDKLELILETLEAIQNFQDEAIDGDRHIAALQLQSTEKKMLNIMAITPKNDVLHKAMAKIYDLHIGQGYLELEKEIDEIRRDKIFSGGGK